jgi:hypothetical protein
MTPAATIHYNKEENKLHVDLLIEKGEMIKADVFDCSGKCVEHIIDKSCKAGQFNMVRKIKNMVCGMYFLRVVNSNNECNVIRFSVS